MVTQRILSAPGHVHLEAPLTLWKRLINKSASQSVDYCLPYSSCIAVCLVMPENFVRQTRSILTFSCLYKQRFRIIAVSSCAPHQAPRRHDAHFAANSRESSKVALKLSEVGMRLINLVAKFTWIIIIIAQLTTNGRNVEALSL